MTPIHHKYREHHWIYMSSENVEGRRHQIDICACGAVRERSWKIQKKRPYSHSKRPFPNKVSRVPKLSKTLQNGSTRKGKGIRHSSAKRSAENRKYLKLRREFLLAHPFCMVCYHNFSNQVHHQRGKEGPWLTDTTEFLAVCGGCHDRIENNREWATKQGYLKLRLTKDQLNQTTT